MTKEEIESRLYQLHQDMKEIAIEMNKQPYPWTYHAAELLGAAGMVLDWAGEISKEEE
jgi:hypothetical protein